MISFKTIYNEGIEPPIQDKIKNATSFEQVLDLICSDAKLFMKFNIEFGFNFFIDYLHILKKHEKKIAQSFYTVKYAKMLIENNKPVSEIIERGIAQYADYSYNYAKLLIKNNKPVPDFIEQSAKQYK